MLMSPYAVGAWSALFVLAVVLLKCGLFAYWEPSMPKSQGVFCMFVANFVTTLIGFIPVIAVAVPVTTLFFMPVIFFILYAPTSRLATHLPFSFSKRKMPVRLRSGIALIFTLLFYLTFFLFYLSVGIESLTVYWILKFLYAFAGIIISIGMTTMWEEYVVHKFAEGRNILDMNFFLPVLKANLAALFILMAVSAAHILPARLSSPNFLVGH